jgi:membrane protein
MENKILNYLKNYRPFQRFLILLKRIKLKKSGVSLYQIGQFFIEELRNDSLFERANNVAFNFTLAIFPAIIFLFTMIPYIPVDNLSYHIMSFLHDVMPESVYQESITTIEDIVNKPRGGLLSFGFILAIYLSTNGTLSLMRAFNRTYQTNENRGYFKTRFIAFFLTLMLTISLVLCIVFLIVGQQIINFLIANGILEADYLYYLILASRFTVIFIFFQLTISLIYFIAPSVKERWHFFSPGSILATLSCLAISFAFSYYINNFGTYNKLYGSIGALIAVMIWFSLMSFVLLIGFELNVSIERAKIAQRQLED